MEQNDHKGMERNGIYLSKGKELKVQKCVQNTFERLDPQITT